MHEIVNTIAAGKWCTWSFQTQFRLTWDIFYLRLGLNIYNELSIIESKRFGQIAPCLASQESYLRWKFMDLLVNFSKDVFPAMSREVYWLQQRCVSCNEQRRVLTLICDMFYPAKMLPRGNFIRGNNVHNHVIPLLQYHLPQTILLYIKNLETIHLDAMYPPSSYTWIKVQVKKEWTRN